MQFSGGYLDFFLENFGNLNLCFCFVINGGRLVDSCEKSFVNLFFKLCCILWQMIFNVEIKVYLLFDLS